MNPEISELITNTARCRSYPQLLEHEVHPLRPPRSYRTQPEAIRIQASDCDMPGFRVYGLGFRVKGEAHPRGTSSLRFRPATRTLEETVIVTHACCLLQKSRLFGFSRNIVVTILVAKVIVLVIVKMIMTVIMILVIIAINMIRLGGCQTPN